MTNHHAVKNNVTKTTNDLEILIAALLHALETSASPAGQKTACPEPMTSIYECVYSFGTMAGEKGPWVPTESLEVPCIRHWVRQVPSLDLFTLTDRTIE